MHRLTKMQQQEYDARYEEEVNAAIDRGLAYWREISPDTRQFLYAELRRALESQLQDEVRARFKTQGAA